MCVYFNIGVLAPQLTFAVFALVVNSEVQQRQQIVIVQQHLMSCLLEGHIYI